MNCQQINEHLIEYLDGRLDSKMNGQVETHLASCAGCRKRVAEFRALATVLEEWQPVEPSRGFDVELAQRIERAESSRWWPAWLRPAYVLAFALLLMGVGLVLWTQQTSLVAPPRVAVRTPAPVAPNRTPTPAATSKDEEVLMLEELPILENAEMLNDFEVLSEIGPTKAKQEKKQL